MKLFSKNKVNKRKKQKQKQKQKQTTNARTKTEIQAETESAKDVFEGKEFAITPTASSLSCQRSTVTADSINDDERNKKKFSLFKSKSSKNSSLRHRSSDSKGNSNENEATTIITTPSTVRCEFEDEHQQQKQGDSGSKGSSSGSAEYTISVISVGEIENQFSTTKTSSNTETTIEKKEEGELQDVSSCARNLFQQLDMAEVDPYDETAEGTELVLPRTIYGIIGNDIETTSGGDDDNEERMDDDENDDPRNRSILKDEEEEEEEDDEIEEGNESAQTTDFSSSSNNNNNSDKKTTTTTSNILSAAFTCTQEDAENCATLPENIVGIIPTACQPIINKHTSLYKQNKRDDENIKINNGLRNNNNDYYLNDNSFNEKFASEFLHGMLNVGYTLIYHKSMDDENWVGRTVNLIFRPGICSRRTIIQPVIEWKTMIGGKSKCVENRTLTLLNIDAISTGNSRGNEKRPASPENNTRSGGDTATTNWCNSTLALGEMGDSDDEFNCFFTITSQDGDIHLFEALNSEDAQRIVAGIRCNAYRLSNSLIEGNTNALMTDFYNNSNEPPETQLSAPEVMNRLSHAFLDGL